MFNGYYSRWLLFAIIALAKIKTCKTSPKQANGRHGRLTFLQGTDSKLLVVSDRSSDDVKREETSERNLLETSDVQRKKRCTARMM